jgi:hypothetical protein
MTCQNDRCGAKFTPHRSWQRFCSERCRLSLHRRLARLKAKASRPAHPIGQAHPPRKRRLNCHWCRGGHVSTDCPNRSGHSVKLYGTTDADGNYVPPPGVNVRVLSIPTTVHSDALTDILKEMER